MTPAVGMAEIASLLGRTRKTALGYSRRADFPAPVDQVDGSPAWDRGAVERWASEHLSGAPFPEHGDDPGDDEPSFLTLDDFLAVTAPLRESVSALLGIIEIGQRNWRYRPLVSPAFAALGRILSFGAKFDREVLSLARINLELQPPVGSLEPEDVQ